jgi:oxygen-independent coproporphyrinogen-3 oxidase
VGELTLTTAGRAVYRRYAALALPRHTSYPISPVWRSTFGPTDFRAALTRAAATRAPLSLYIHLPFCEKLCYYCACTKEIVPAARRQKEDPVPALLDGLAREAALLAELVGVLDVRQVHLGGGSPTFLTPDQLARLWQILSANFRLAADAEVAVEIDPRITTREQLALLRTLGFNRVSLGVQDFDPRVQETVNRIQPFACVERTVRWCRELCFDSLNFDLIYGLPYQTLDSMAATLDQTLALAPDRVAFYRLAVIPDIFRWQNTFREADLPEGDLALDLNLLALKRFRAAGYEFIGLDHFARPDEPLARARRAGTLQRNFQGMTTGKALALVGLGPSAISQLDDTFAQNHKTSSDWHAAVASDLPTARGLALSFDDRLRRELLQQLYGHGEVDIPALEENFGIDFASYFADELSRLESLAADGLVEIGPESLRLTPLLGRLLVRVVAAVFDAYLPPDAYRAGLPAPLASRVG